MKLRLFLLLIINIFIISTHGQVIKFDYKIDYTSVENSSVSANISVSVTEGEPEFTFSLYKGDFNGELFIKSSPVSKFNYTFENIPEGKYFLKIEDKFKRPAGVTIIVQKDNADKQ